MKSITILIVIVIILVVVYELNIHVLISNKYYDDIKTEEITTSLESMPAKNIKPLHEILTSQNSSSNLESTYKKASTTIYQRPTLPDDYIEPTVYHPPLPTLSDDCEETTTPNDFDYEETTGNNIIIVIPPPSTMIGIPEEVDSIPTPKK